MFDDSYMVALAARRGLSFKPHKLNRHLFGGSKTVNFSELTEDQVHNKELRHYIERNAMWTVLAHFARRIGNCLEVEIALSPERKHVVVVWTNYNMGPTYALYEGWREGGWEGVKEFLDDAMNECLPPETERSELLWWWPVIQS